MRVIFATWAMAEYQGRILSELGASRRLISFWELKERPPGVLGEYVQHGKAGKRSKNLQYVDGPLGELDG